MQAMSTRIKPVQAYCTTLRRLLCVFIYRTLIKITAHQMVWSNLRQPSCGGEVLTNVPSGAETRLQRNGILSRNKRLKLSDSSSSRAERAWKQHSGATESHCGGVTLDQMTGVESSRTLAPHWGDTEQELSRPPLSERFIHTAPPSSPRSPPPTEVIHLPLSLSVSLSLQYFVQSPTLSARPFLSLCLYLSAVFGFILRVVTPMAPAQYLSLRRNGFIVKDRGIHGSN